MPHIPTQEECMRENNCKPGEDDSKCPYTSPDACTMNCNNCESKCSCCNGDCIVCGEKDCGNRRVPFVLDTPVVTCCSGNCVRCNAEDCDNRDEPFEP